MFKYKKAISPVVAVALLLVVTVVAVVGFQNWYTNYQSQLTSDVSQKSSQQARANIEFISNDGTLYVTNTGTSNLSITSINVGGIDCQVSQNLTPGVNNFSIGNCLNTNLSTNKVVIITQTGIIKKDIFIGGIENVSLSSPPATPALNCSALGLTGGEWISVLGNPSLGTSDFCVMKYEAKSDGSTNCGGGPCPISQAATNPWVSINQTNARAKCQQLGAGYDLITNNEWMSIARLIENDTTNWANGIKGSTVASGGGLYRGNVNLNDVISCGSNTVLTGSVAGTNCVVGTRNKRTHNVSGELIWDLSGNVWEWNNDTIDCTGGYPCANMINDISPAEEWIEHTAINIYGQFSYNSIRPINNTWNSNHGMGRIYTDINAATPSGQIHGVLRSGGWYNDADAGVFDMSLHRAPSSSFAFIGFRCVHRP